MAGARVDVGAARAGPEDVVGRAHGGVVSRVLGAGDVERVPARGVLVDVGEADGATAGPGVVELLVCRRVRTAQDGAGAGGQAALLGVRGAALGDRQPRLRPRRRRRSRQGRLEGLRSGRLGDRTQLDHALAGRHRGREPRDHAGDGATARDREAHLADRGSRSRALAGLDVAGVPADGDGRLAGSAATRRRGRPGRAPARRCRWAGSLWRLVVSEPPLVSRSSAPEGSAQLARRAGVVGEEGGEPLLTPRGGALSAQHHGEAPIPCTPWWRRWAWPWRRWRWGRRSPAGGGGRAGRCGAPQALSATAGSSRSGEEGARDDRRTGGTGMRPSCSERQVLVNERGLAPGPRGRPAADSPLR